MGRVRELLISSKNAGIIPVFAENEKKFLCLRFSITHPHDPEMFPSEIQTTICNLKFICGIPSFGIIPFNTLIYYDQIYYYDLYEKY
jgi:hypothetical protein